ncbi:MAG: GNAT family N-acetyltransferase [Actinomycetota bacterium]|nr:GNAT family N-acetyltransferase [Actinomycetota bacterium]
MSAPISRASPERAPELAALLGRAFEDDPMLVWPFGVGRIEAITNFFLAFDEQTAALGWLWEAGAGLGVAAWIPPGSDEVMLEIDRSMRPALAEAEGLHGEMWEWIASNFPDEPFWYLDHIAVRTDHRGSGLGAMLIGHGLAFADRDGVPAFLETGRPENVGYYERRGFRTVSDADAPGGGPHIWFMRYDP